MKKFWQNLNFYNLKPHTEVLKVLFQAKKLL